jgi:methylated-DNA-[protein]-cysteine S-methyltransferase
MRKIVLHYVKTSLGGLMLGSFDEQLCLCDWRYRKMRDRIDRRLQKGLDALFVDGETNVTRNAGLQLEMPKKGQLKPFN